MKQSYSNENSIVPAIPVIIIQFLSGFAESVVRSILMIFIAFSIVKIFEFHQQPLVNMVNLFAIVPTLLFSSYAGKFADKYNKKTMLRGLTVYQLIIASVAALCVYYNLLLPLLFILLFLGIQQTILYSVRFSILAEYFNTTKQIGVATGYIEFSWFASVLIGQMYGSWAVTSQKISLLAVTIFVAGVLSVGAGLFLPKINNDSLTNNKNNIDLPIKFYWNPLKDFWYMFEEVIRDSRIYLNMNVTGWFWAFCAINTTQTALFAARYLGVDGHIFGIIMGVGTIGMGLGSVACAKISRGVIHREIIGISAIVVSLVTFVILFLHHEVVLMSISCRQFIFSAGGIILFALVFIKAIALGFYSLTCYTEAQIQAAGSNKSQVMSTIAVFSAIYVIVGSGICTVLQIIVSSWMILFITAIVNFILAILYYKYVRIKSIVDFAK